MEADIAISIALVTGVVLVVNQLARLIRNRQMHKTVREALSRDNDALPGLIAKIDEASPAGPGGDERAGLVLIALALALALYAWIASGDPEDMRNLAGLAVFPGFVGVALLGRAVWARRRGEVS